MQNDDGKLFEKYNAFHWVGMHESEYANKGKYNDKGVFVSIADEKTKYEEYIKYLQTEYIAYLDKLGLTLDDRSMDEHLFMFINDGDILKE